MVAVISIVMINQQVVALIKATMLLVEAKVELWAFSIKKRMTF
jgi:hypothetical protein